MLLETWLGERVGGDVFVVVEVVGVGVVGLGVNKVRGCVCAFGIWRGP